MNESNVFFGSRIYHDLKLVGRESDLRQLSYMLDNEKIIVLRSLPHVGKTAFVESGALTDKKLTEKNSIAFKFDIPIFKNTNQTIVNQFITLLQKSVTEPTCIDKVFEDDGSFWYIFKKIQFRYKDKKRIYVVLDNFANFFSYPEKERNQFLKLLSAAVYGNIPDVFNNQLQKIMLGQSEQIFSKDAISLLYDNINLSLLFITEDYAYNYLTILKDYFSGIFQNTINLLPFDIDTAKQAIKHFCKIKLSEEAISVVLEKLTNGTNSILPGELKNACNFLQNFASQNNYSEITAEIIEKSQYFCISHYKKILDTLDSDQRNKLEQFALETVVDDEDKPLPIYSRIAQTKYELTTQTIDYLIDNQIFDILIMLDGRIFLTPSNIEIFNNIKAQKNENNYSKLHHFQPDTRQTLENPNDFSNKKPLKYKRGQMFLTICIAIATISLAFVFLAFSLKGSAEKNERAARSNMLSAFAFQKLETDPTFSLRLAQEAVSLDTSNAQAYSALLNSFYNTDIFYSIAGRLDTKVISANICNGGKNILAITRNPSLEKNSVLLLRQNGDTILELPHKKIVTSATMNQTNNLIITTSYDSVARIFDLNGNLKLEHKGHQAVLWTADFSPDGSKFLTGGSDFNVEVCNIDGSRLSVLSGHGFDVYCAHFSPDNQYIVTSGGDNTARIWTTTGKQLKVLEINEDTRFSMSIIVSAVFSPDGKYILTASNDYINKNHKARLWDLNGIELVTFSGHEDWLNSAFFSPDGNHIITASRDKTVRVWDITGKLEKILKGHGSNVWFSSFLADNQSIMSVGDDKTVRLWCIGKRFESYKNAINVNFACFSPDGLNLMVVQDKSAQIWDLTGEKIAVFKGHTQTINTARFSPDGKFVATASSDGTTHIYSREGKLLKVLDQHSAAVNDAVFSPDGKKLITVSNDSTIIIYDLLTNKYIKSYEHNGCVTSVAFSPSGETFVTGGTDKKVVLHSLDGNVVRTFAGHDARVNSVAFSPDGNYVISTSSDESAVLWNKIGEIVFTLRGYENKVNSAVFSPDGKYIITTSDDGKSRLWTIDGRDIMTFRHDGRVKSAVFSPDGKYILTVCCDNKNNKTVKLYMINADGINRHIDKLDLYGPIWKPDAETLKKYGL